MPLVILIISLLLVKHLYDTYYKLVPYVYDPAQFNLPENNQDRDLEVNLFATPIPPYLLGSLPGKDE